MPDRKVMLITGTRKGIGRYLAEYYVDKGFLVEGCSRKPTKYGHQHFSHSQVDVTNEIAVRNLFGRIRKKYGRLDILLNNAGIASMNLALLTPLPTADRILRTNVLGTFLCCQQAARLMRKNRFGRIVNFSTMVTTLKLQGEAIYGASKAAIENLTKTLAYELAPLGITVNAIGPTPIKTDLTRSVPEESMDALIDRQAIKRWGEFRDVSNAINFLISPKSDFVTGQVVYLGGVS